MKQDSYIYQFTQFLLSLLFLLWIHTPSAQASCPDTLAAGQAAEEFFQRDFVHQIDLQFSTPNWFDTLSYHKEIRDSLEITTYTPTEVCIDGQSFPVAGIRFKGNSSYDFHPGKKKSFKVDLDRFGKSDGHFGIKKFNLLNSFKDPTFLREKLYLDMLRDAGAHGPACSFAQVSINGEPFGLFLLVEQVDKDFLKSHFDSKKGTLFKGVPQAYLIYKGETKSDYIRYYNLKSKDSDKSWKRLIALIKAADPSVNESNYLSTLQTQLDLESLIKAWTVNNLTANPDAFNLVYRHNFYLYFHPKTDNFHWINYDGNYAFCAWSPKWTYRDAVQVDPFYIAKPLSDRPVQAHLFAIPEFRARYLEFYRQALRHLFHPEKLFTKIDELADMIRPYVLADSYKMYTDEDFEMGLEGNRGDVLDPGAFIPGLKELVKDRYLYLVKGGGLKME